LTISDAVFYTFGASEIYRRLGQLEALEDLAIGWAKSRNQYLRAGVTEVGEPSIPDFKLNCSLAQGLGHMSRLKRLWRLNVLNMPDRAIGRNEILWMGKNWPQLTSLGGLYVNHSVFNEEELDRSRGGCPYIFDQ